MLRTERLDLIPASLEHLEAELRAPGAIGELLGVRVPEGWPPGELDRDALVFFRSRLLSGGPGAEGWYCWYGVTRNGQGGREALVASAGYFGPPVHGTVEIGYSVVPSARRRGYASEMVRALVDRAFDDPAVQAVIAHTTDANIGSTRVLSRCGFHRAGPGSEPEQVLYRTSRPPHPR